MQSSIDNYEKKEWTLRIKETNSLLDNLTKEKMNYTEEQKNLQNQIDVINEFNANQEVIFVFTFNIIIKYKLKIQNYLLYYTSYYYPYFDHDLIYIIRARKL